MTYSTSCSVGVLDIQYVESFLSCRSLSFTARALLSQHLCPTLHTSQATAKALHGPIPPAINCALALEVFLINPANTFGINFATSITCATMDTITSALDNISLGERFFKLPRELRDEVKGPK